MRYVSVRDPASLSVAQRVLAVASKRFDRPVLGFLSREEVQALLDAPDQSTWSGQRDAVLFAVLYNTGARVSEMIRLRIADVLLDRAHAVHLHGKGRKERVIPLWKSTAAQMRAWFERLLARDLRRSCCCGCMHSDRPSVLVLVLRPNGKRLSDAPPKQVERTDAGGVG